MIKKLFDNKYGIIVNPIWGEHKFVFNNIGIMNRYNIEYKLRTLMGDLEIKKRND